MATTTSISLESLTDRVIEGERITPEEALALYRLPLEELGALANHRRMLARTDAFDGKGNEIVTYIIDRNINYTNICNVYCKFCAFYRTEKDDDTTCSRPSRSDEKIEGTRHRRHANAHAGRPSSEARRSTGISTCSPTSGRSIRTINIHGFSRRSSTTSPRSSGCRWRK